MQLPATVTWFLALVALLLCGPGCNHEPPLPGTEDDRLVILLDDPPRNLDPRFTTDATSMRVSKLVFSSLVTVDNPKMTPEPQLALRWTSDPERPEVWTITLRRGVTWHDGEPFDADDVVYTFRSVIDPGLGSPFRDPYQAHIRTVEAIDTHTVRFVLREAYATFITDLVLGVVPEHVCRPNGGRFPAGGYIGTGPYQFDSRAGERRLDLTRWERSFEGTPPIRHLVFRTIKDEGTRLMALLGGSADLIQNGVSPVLTKVLEGKPRLTVSSHPSIAFTYVALNLREEGLASRQVRQALALAIPRRRIMRTHLHGNATLSTGMLAPMHWAYEPDVIRWDFDPDRARELLTQAGYGAGGKTLRITIKISTNRFRRTIARTIAQAWLDIGVEASVRAYEFGTFFADIKQGNFQAYLLDLPEPMEPDMYRWMLHGLGTPQKHPRASGSSYATADRRFLPPGALDAHVAKDPICRTWQWRAVKDGTRNWVSHAFGVEPPYSRANRMAYANPLVDCRIELGQLATERAERIPRYREVQKILAEDLPVIPLWHPHVQVISSRRVAGFEPLPNLRFAGLARTRIVSRR